jgi:hypothetical protein
MPLYNGRSDADLVIDNAMTAISVAYPNGGAVGDALTPTIQVSKQSDRYFIHGRETWAPEATDLRAPGTWAKEITGLALSTDVYYAVEHALQTPVAWEERQRAGVSPLSPDRDATELVTAKILLQREIYIKNLATTTANYPAGNVVTLAGVTQFNDYVNSDPIGVFKTARRYMHSLLFIEPNTAVIPYQVMSQLEDHPDFIERIKYSERGILTKEIIATLIGVPNIVVPGFGWNSANPGQAASIGYLWGKDVVLAYVPPQPGLKTPAFAYEFAWTYPGGQTQVIDRWQEPGRKSDLIRCQRRYDLKGIVLDSNGKLLAGYLIKNAVA